MNVRYEAGKHAHYINNIRTELKEVLNAHEKLHFLKERLGHTPTEVLG
jgi:acid phosphatase family membrane protein YuiD